MYSRLQATLYKFVRIIVLKLSIQFPLTNNVKLCSKYVLKCRYTCWKIDRIRPFTQGVCVLSPPPLPASQMLWNFSLTPTRTHARTQARKLARKHACTHAHTHASTHAHTHFLFPLLLLSSHSLLSYRWRQQQESATEELKSFFFRNKMKRNWDIIFCNFFSFYCETKEEHLLQRGKFLFWDFLNYFFPLQYKILRFCSRYS